MFRVLAYLLLALIFPPTRPAVEFLQPKVPIIMASHAGTEIPLQIRIEPQADNRAYAITWCGEGAHVHSLDGADDAAIHPVSPLTIRVYAGRCDLVATVFGPGNVVRARVVMTLRVCGDEDNPCDPH